MTHAYDEIYLGYTQRAMGDMLHFAVYDLKWELEHFFDAFIRSGIAESVYKGYPHYVAGMSGYEIAYEVYHFVTGTYCKVRPKYAFEKSPEYFLGWSLAYYSWDKNISYKTISQAISVNEIFKMYNPYHEMDVRQFVIAMDDKLKYAKEATLLKRLRAYAGLTQKQLAVNSGISQRMIEQYEQGRKDISRASASTVYQISQALGCRVEDLIAGQL